MRRAFLVYGPESSGNRLMTRILCGCGCYGDGEHHQRLNDGPPPAGVDIAWFRSVPYAGYWPDLVHFHDIVYTAGFEPLILVMMRDNFACACSQMLAPHVHNIEEAYQHIERAYRHIFDAINKRDTPYVIITYEALSIPGYLNWLLDRLGLELQKDLEPIDNRNEKYYSDEHHEAEH